MAITFNHTIVAARDKAASAEFLAELFNLPSPKPFGPFLVVSVGAENPVSLDYAEVGDGEIHPQHYAFLVSEEEFDAIYGRILARGLQHWADPQGRGQARSTTTTAAAGCTSRIQSGTTWRS